MADVQGLQTEGRGLGNERLLEDNFIISVILLLQLALDTLCKYIDLWLDGSVSQSQSRFRLEPHLLPSLA